MSTTKNVTIIFAVFIISMVVLNAYNSKYRTIVSPVSVENTQAVIALTDGRQCYTYTHEATVTEPYKVSEFIDMTINGTSVVGTKRGTQAGPDMTNGYTGAMLGTMVNNKISNVYSYEIEGSKNKEQELYQAGFTGIEKLRYPLIEDKGMLVPDTTKDFTIMNYARVGCEASN